MIRYVTFKALATEALSHDAGWMSGRALREAINGSRKWWGRVSGPSFYYNMNRMEEEMLVMVWNTQDMDGPVRLFKRFQ